MPLPHDLTLYHVSWLIILSGGTLSYLSIWLLNRWNVYQLESALGSRSEWRAPRAPAAAARRDADDVPLATMDGPVAPATDESAAVESDSSVPNRLLDWLDEEGGRRRRALPTGRRTSKAPVEETAAESDPLPLDEPAEHLDEPVEEPPVLSAGSERGDEELQALLGEAEQFSSPETEEETLHDPLPEPAVAPRPAGRSTVKAAAVPAADKSPKPGADPKIPTEEDYYHEAEELVRAGRVQEAVGVWHQLLICYPSGPRSFAVFQQLLRYSAQAPATNGRRLSFRKSEEPSQPATSQTANRPPARRQPAKKALVVETPAEVPTPALASRPTEPAEPPVSVPPAAPAPVAPRPAPAVRQPISPAPIAPPPAVPRGSFVEQRFPKAIPPAAPQRQRPSRPVRAVSPLDALLMEALPTDRVKWVRLAREFEKDSVERVIPALEGHIRQSPARSDLWESLALAYLSLGRVAAAVDIFQHLAKSRPEDARYAFYLGHLRTLAGEREAAHSQFERALELAPSGLLASRVRDARLGMDPDR